MKKYCDRFSSVLRDAFMNEKAEVKSSIQYIYKAVKAYRAVNVSETKQYIEKSDFYSQAQKQGGKFGNPPKKVALTMFSCSCFFTEQKLLEKVTNLKSRIDKGESKIAKGTLKFRNGPILVNKKKEHIDWFLFEKADVVGDFEFV
ncbi:hypothetical protein [Helicobacter sp. T3_23-1059]